MNNVFNRKKWLKEYYENNREKILAYQRKWASEHREERKISNRKWVEKNREKKNRLTREQRHALKIEVLTHYSNPLKCFCCGETAIEFLTINHLNGKGAEQRRNLKIRGGNTFYRWLKNNNYPKGFNVLCLNCNFSLGHYGYCPHQKEIKI